MENTVTTLDNQRNIILKLMTIPLNHWTFIKGFTSPGWNCTNTLDSKYETMLGSFSVTVVILPESSIVCIGPCSFGEPKELIDNLIKYLEPVKPVNESKYAENVMSVCNELIIGEADIIARNKRFEIVEKVIAIPAQSWFAFFSPQSKQRGYQSKIGTTPVSIVVDTHDNNNYISGGCICIDKLVFTELRERIWNKFRELENYQYKLLDQEENSQLDFVYNLLK